MNVVLFRDLVCTQKCTCSYTVGAQIAPYPNRSHRSDLGRGKIKYLPKSLPWSDLGMLPTQITPIKRFGKEACLSYPNSSNVIETSCYLIYSTFIRILKRSYDRLLGKISVSEKGDINLRNSSVRDDDR